MYTKETIGNKPIYIVEYHQQVLLPWAIESRRLGSPLFLITFDHHTDIQIPFLKQLVGAPDIIEKSADRLSRYDIQNDERVIDCISNLACDEQIQAAIKLGIFDSAFVISWDGITDVPLSTEMSQYYMKMQAFLLKDSPWGDKTTSEPNLPERPFSYISTENNIYIVGIDAETTPDEAITDAHLSRRLQILHNISSSVSLFSELSKARYILDIDLDYFHSREALEPKSCQIFYDLIKSAQAITIATEPEFVKDLAKGIDSPGILDKMKWHIGVALSK
jgi:hypothetical protein